MKRIKDIREEYRKKIQAAKSEEERERLIIDFDYFEEEIRESKTDRE